MKTISYVALLAALTFGFQSAWADVEVRKGESLHSSLGIAESGVYPSRGGPIDD
jgi:hypothetical protein